MHVFGTEERAASMVASLDGVEIQGVTEANEEAGYLVRWRRDVSGWLVIEDGEPQVEVLLGVVSIREIPSFDPIAWALDTMTDPDDSGEAV